MSARAGVDRVPAWLVAGVVLLAALSLLFVRAARRGDFATELSTYAAHPKGARALLLLWAAQGVTVERRHLDLERIEQRGSLVILVAPGAPKPEGGKPQGTIPQADEAGSGGAGGARGEDEEAQPDAEEAEEDDGAGGAPEDDDARRHRGEGGAPGGDPLQLFGAPTGPGEFETGPLLAWVEQGNTLFLGTARDLPLLEQLGVHWEARAGAAPTLAHPVVPTPFTAGVRHVQGTALATLRADAGDAVPLLADEAGSIALLVRRGEGRVVLTSAPELMRNDRLATADNARFAASVGNALARGGLVQVDEFHHGFRSGRSLAGFAIRHGLHFAALQGLLACALFLLATRRFGAPRAAVREERRATADFLLAMARIYQHGGHAGAAGTGLRRAAVARAARRAGLPVNAPVEAIATRLGERGLGDLGRALTAFDSAAAALLQGNPGERELLELARRAASLRAAASPGSGAGGRRSGERRGTTKQQPGASFSSKEPRR